MADRQYKKGSELAAADTLDGTEAVLIVQGGETRRATTQQMADLTAESLELLTWMVV